MIVTTKGRYALRVMIELAKSGGYVSLKQIAEEQEIPHKYAENIMTELVKAGLLEGSRGKNGGYRLARAPEEVTALDILRATERSISASSCSEDGACPRAEECPTLPMWRALDETLDNFFRGYTLKDLVGKEEPV